MIRSVSDFFGQFNHSLFVERFGRLSDDEWCELMKASVRPLRDSRVAPLCP